MPPRPSEESDTGLRAIFRPSQGPREGIRKPLAEEAPAEAGTNTWIKPFVGISVAGLITVVSGVLYLSILGPGSSTALDIAYALSLTALPITALILVAPYFTLSLTKASPWALTAAGLGISIGVSCLAAFVSLYIALALSGACLAVLTVGILRQTRVVRRLMGKDRIELPQDGEGRKAVRVEGGEDRIEEMRFDSSWLTERGELTVAGQSVSPVSLNQICSQQITVTARSRSLPSRTTPPLLHLQTEPPSVNVANLPALRLPSSSETTIPMDAGRPGPLRWPGRGAAAG